MKFPDVGDYVDACNEVGIINDLLIDVILLMPDRYFYSEFINDLDFRKMRADIKGLRSQLSFHAYKNDSALKIRLKGLTGRYNDLLSIMTQQAKSDLCLYFLYLDYETKRNFIIKTVDDYRLLSHLMLGLKEYVVD